jgi:hypothetical protein
LRWSTVDSPGALVDPNVVDIAGERRREIGGFGETDSEVYRAEHWIVRQRRRADLPTFYVHLHIADGTEDDRDCRMSDSCKV